MESTYCDEHAVQVAEATAAFRQSMKQAARGDAPLMGWLDIMLSASISGRTPSSSFYPICREILVVNALLSYIELLKWMKVRGAP